MDDGQVIERKRPKVGSMLSCLIQVVVEGLVVAFN